MLKYKKYLLILIILFQAFNNKETKAKDFLCEKILNENTSSLIALESILAKNLQDKNLKLNTQNKFDIKNSAIAVCNHNIKSLFGSQIIDEIKLNAGDRVLLVKQTNKIQNGLWIVQDLEWIRPGDFMSGNSAINALISITSGSINSGSLWLCTNKNPNSIIDTNNLNFTKLFFTEVQNPAVQDYQEKEDIKNNVIEINQAAIDENLEFILPEEDSIITKAGGAVTTATDFASPDYIVKTTGATTVTSTNITIDSSNNISGVNTLQLEGGSSSIPSLFFSGNTTSGIYSPSAGKINISSLGNELATFGTTGTTISSGNSLTVNSPATFGATATFNNAAVFNGTTNTLNGTTNLSGTTNISGTTTVTSGTITLSGTTNMTGQTNISGPLSSTSTTNFSGPLNVTGATTLRDTLTATGINANTLNVTGASNLNSSLNVAGTTTFATGTVTTPSLTFNGSTSSGIYSPTTDQVAVSAQGAQRMLFASGSISIPTGNVLAIPSGSAASPSLTFASDTNTGIYNSAADEITLVSNGAKRVEVSNNYTTLNNGLNLNSIPSMLGNGTTTYNFDTNKNTNNLYINIQGASYPYSITLTPDSTALGRVIFIRNSSAGIINLTAASGVLNPTTISIPGCTIAGTYNGLILFNNGTTMYLVGKSW